MNNILNFIRIKFNNLKRSLRQSLSWIWILIILLSPFIQLLCKNVRSSICVELLIISFSLIVMFLDQFFYNKQNNDSIPVMRKKFAKYEKSTAKIAIKKEDLNEIASYLLDLQEYFEEKGMLE